VIDLRLLLCGLVAWGAVGATVGVAGDGDIGFAAAFGVVLAGVGIVTLLLIRSLPPWCGAVLVVGGAAMVSAALQIQAWTDPEIDRVFRGDVIVTAGVQGTVERVDTSNGPVWAPAARWRVLLGATTIEGPGGVIAVDLPVVLETSDPQVAAGLPQPGSLIEARGAAVATPGSTRAIGVIRIDSVPLLVREPGWADRVANRMRDALLATVMDVPPAAGGVVAGLAIGDESRLPEQTRIDMRDSGLAHLMAVSGGNVAIVVGAVYLLAGLLRIGIRGRVAIALVVLIGYVILVRPEPSVVRAGVMAGVVQVGYAIGRDVLPLRALAITVTTIVAIDPLATWSIGFVLSVAATTGLVVIAPRLGQSVVAAATAAQLGVAPFTLWWFGATPIIALATNVLAVPVASTVMILAPPLLGIAAFAPDVVAEWCAIPVAAGARWVWWVAELGARVALPDWANIGGWIIVIAAITRRVVHPPARL